ncbi:MAG TPA: carbamoyltransferase C-terminal domain-containing protein, partial [Chthoniobacterales bacterium]|nr:carbamoyltransferase C-terminal domain-containing protein [Chthoniobacterales bacterium]
YGSPKFLDEMRRIVLLKDDGQFETDLDYFVHAAEGVTMSWERGEPLIGPLFSNKLIELLGPAREPGFELTQRHQDIAASLQAMYEEAFFHRLNWLQKRTALKKLTLAGGCAMNSVANGKVYLRTPFRKMYLPAAAGDAGGAIGAAAVVLSKVESGKEKVENGQSPNLSASCVRLSSFAFSAYLGPQSSEQEIRDLIEKRKAEIAGAGCKIEPITNNQELCSRTATAIAAGCVIGWFQGRMEWGPRALGNRSILCDPRRADMKEILNLKIKRRESFRPFAPSILRESVAEWFEQDDDVPFMMEVFQIRPEKRALIPAVTHVDGSGRLQTVHRESNPLYHELITAFQSLTSIPILLNTSFNENEPVVCRPEEALDCFLRTKMDGLVLGRFLIERRA